VCVWLRKVTILEIQEVSGQATDGSLLPLVKPLRWLIQAITGNHVLRTLEDHVRDMMRVRTCRRKAICSLSLSANSGLVLSMRSIIGFLSTKESSANRFTASRRRRNEFILVSILNPRDGLSNTPPDTLVITRHRYLLTPRNKVD